MAMFTTYVLYSHTFNKIYIGYSSNIEQRLIAHNHPNNMGYTKRYKPWVIVHKETFANKNDAMKREKELKSAKGREFIWNSIIKKLDTES